MKNYKCILAYAGTHYFGWQKTKIGPTVEEAVEKALEKALRHPVYLQAASRTDRGVHAEGQVINFLTHNPPPKWQSHFRSLLPPDIIIHELEEVSEDFHPTTQAKGKIYHYSICNAPVQLPFKKEISWHFSYTIQIDKMQTGAKMLVGTHDFSSFTTVPTDNPIRTLNRIEIEETPYGEILIQVEGEKFLYKMVRNIVGTLAYIGSGKISLTELPEILKSKNRSAAGVTAPAHGLCLKKVFY